MASTLTQGKHDQSPALTRVPTLISSLLFSTKQIEYIGNSFKVMYQSSDQNPLVASTLVQNKSSDSSQCPTRSWISALMIFLTSLSITVPQHFIPAPLDTLSFLCYTKHLLTSGSLNLVFFLLWVLTSLRILIKCHLLSKSFLDFSI